MIGTWGRQPRCRFLGGKHQGEAIGYVQPNRPGGRKWVIVLWDGEDAPTLHQIERLELLEDGHWRKANVM